MLMNLFKNSMQYVIDIVTLCRGEIEFEKEKKKNPGNDKWELLDVIPLMPLLGVTNHQPILHMSKIIVHYYSTDEINNQFSIGYMIIPSLNCNKLFREQFEKCSIVSFHKKTIEKIRYVLRKKNTCVMALIIIYDIIEEKPKKCI